MVFQEKRIGTTNSNSYFSITFICNSSNCFLETILGASDIKHDADAVLGNAITSLILSVLDNNIVNLSNPRAIPPCGGVPYFNASTKKPNFSCCCVSSKPNASNTFD